MDSSSMTMIGFISVIISILIIRAILQTATNTKKTEREMRVHTLILSKMALKAGVPKEEITTIFDTTV